MKKLNKFQKFTAGSFLIISTLIGLFLFLNTFTHPRVIQVSLSGGNNSAYIKNQQIRIDFNRPIQKDNIVQYISITPEFKFRELWSANTLVLVPQTILDSQTDYTIKISKDVKDIYNETFDKDFIYTFTTEVPQFAVIEKKFDSTKNTIATYNADLTNRKEIFERENIKFYGINNNFLVVVTENNYTNNIEVLNRKTQEVRNFKLNNIRINAFAFSESIVKNEFAYTKQEIEVKGNAYYIPKSPAKIFIYNIDSQSEVEFNPQNTASDVTALQYSSDGNSLLYKTGDSFYNLAETSDQQNHTSIGRFLSEGNFNFDNSKIVFLAYDPLSVYESTQFLTVFDSNRVTTPIKNKDISVLDPQFKHKTDRIVFAEKFKELETTKGIYKIVETDLEGNKTDVISNEKYSLELPKLSYDDRYIAMEEYTELNLKNYMDTRSLGFQNKPSKANIVILDTKNNKLYDSNIIGIDVKWL